MCKCTVDVNICADGTYAQEGTYVSSATQTVIADEC